MPWDLSRTVFIGIITFVGIARIAELIYSKKNYNLLIAEGGVEYGKTQLPYMIGLHALWFISLLSEFFLYREHTFKIDLLTIVSLSALVLGMFLRVYSMKKLGKYWSTKIVVLPNQKRVKTGIFKFFNHPNYFGVWLEVIFIPLIFKLWLTSILFGIFKTFFLIVRISTEEKALKTLQ